jgi:hypothetical protein
MNAEAQCRKAATKDGKWQMANGKSMLLMRINSLGKLHKL